MFSNYNFPVWRYARFLSSRASLSACPSFIFAFHKNYPTYPVPFLRYASYLSKVAIFLLPCICHPCWGWLYWSFRKFFGIRKLGSWAISVVCMMIDVAILIEHRLVTDGDDRQTQWGRSMCRVASCRTVKCRFAYITGLTFDKLLISWFPIL